MYKYMPASHICVYNTHTHTQTLTESHHFIPVLSWEQVFTASYKPLKHKFILEMLRRA